MSWENKVSQPFVGRVGGASVGTKIILPYLLLTLVVAGVGAFVVTNLVTGSLQERFNNQLLDAGRVVAERMVAYEQERLTLLRLIANSQGVPEALSAGDQAALTALVPQIAATGNAAAVILLNQNGGEIYSWWAAPPSTPSESAAVLDFSQAEAVQRVLSGYEDEFGDKRVFLGRTPTATILFTVGPVWQGEEQVGAILIGTDLNEMAVGLTETALARVTLYDHEGDVLATTLGSPDVNDRLLEPSFRYEMVLALLQESPAHYRVVTQAADSQVPLRSVELLNQTYQLAYGDWRLRDHSFGLFSVALPSNFIVNTAATSRNLLSLLFSLATVAVFTLGFFIARRIVQPIDRLVEVSVAVTQGDLEQRTGIRRSDEIGLLADSFDLMTTRLAQRNQQLSERASELQAILHSIADGVIVLGADDQIVTSNPAAQRLLQEMSHNFSLGPLRELGQESAVRRYQIGNRTLSALAAPIMTPNNQTAGTVIVLRDITDEVEAENLKSAFITSISHELRTPLTIVKAYSGFLLTRGRGQLSEDLLQYIHKIKNASAQLERHINQLIHISEIQAGTINLHKKQQELAQVIGRVAESWQEPLANKGLALVIQVPPEPVWVVADSDRLGWAIENLVSNAHNYTPAGGRITLHLYHNHTEARLDVIDTGVGIDTADLPHLFNRFFRANNEANFSVGGVGLGLYISRAIIEMHDGRIWAQSKVGSGTTFSVALPLASDKRDLNGNPSTGS
jgi:signal transduction histidine kinase